MIISKFALLTDENIHPGLVIFLQKSGFVVDDIKEMGFQKVSDRVILERSLTMNQVVVTHDSDFGKIIFTEQIPFMGVIYLRPGHIAAHIHIQTFQAILDQNLDLQPPFMLIAENTGELIRIRLRNRIEL